jgi:hypothetical protein
LPHLRRSAQDLLGNRPVVTAGIVPGCGQRDLRRGQRHQGTDASCRW